MKKVWLIVIAIAAVLYMFFMPKHRKRRRSQSTGKFVARKRTRTTKKVKSSKSGRVSMFDSRGKKWTVKNAPKAVRAIWQKRAAKARRKKG